MLAAPLPRRFAAPSRARKGRCLARLTGLFSALNLLAMTETTQAAKRRLERPFGELLKAQERFVKAEGGFERARAARDDAIRRAAEAGFTRRSIAQMANLTAGRVQQIIDQARKASS